VSPEGRTDTGEPHRVASLTVAVPVCQTGFALERIYSNRPRREWDGTDSIHVRGQTYPYVGAALVPGALSRRDSGLVLERL
jgi:hypothetical protein